MKSVLDYAKEYIANGWAVTPVLYKLKKAFVTGWTEKEFPNEGNLNEWFGNGKKYNIGIRTGEISHNLIALDCDSEVAREELVKLLPQLEQTRRSEGKKKGGHYWVYVDEPFDTIRIKDENDLTTLEVMANGTQVLVEPSIHPDSTSENEIMYHWTNTNLPITIPTKILLSTIQYIAKKHNWKTKNKEPEERKIIEHYNSSEIKLRFSDFLNLSNFNQVGDELVGSHPYHGSDSGQNFRINTNKGLWHCFRCDSGGDALQLWAIGEGFLSCEDAGRGALKGDLFKKVIGKARERFGEGTIPMFRTKIKSNPDEVTNLEDWTEIASKHIAEYLSLDKPATGKARMEVVNGLVNNYSFITFSDTEEVYYYNEDEGIYNRGGEPLIKAKIQNILNSSGMEHMLNTNFVNEVIGSIKRKTYMKREEFEASPSLICLANGVLNLDTYEFESHSSKFRFLTKLAAEYRPECDCPKFKKFLQEAVPEMSIPVIYELIGYCLYRDHFIQKGFLMLGKGSNGKSTLIRAIEKLVGSENCTNISLHDLEEKRFSIANLYGKQVNFYADLSSKELDSTAKFKMLTGGDSITAEFKGKNMFNFRNYAKMIFSCNTIPVSEDDTYAYFRRWTLIDFPNKFEGKSDNKNLINEITTNEEISGILNEALKGLKRLIDNQCFSNELATEEVRERIIRASDSVAAFIMDELNINPKGFIPKQELYEAYLSYCGKVRSPPVSDQKFFQRLLKRISLEDYKPNVGGKRVYCWRGIEFKNRENYIEDERM